MRWQTAVCAITFLALLPSHLLAEEPISSEELAQAIETIEEIDTQLLAARGELKTAPNRRERRGLRAQIRRLEQEREKLFEQIAPAIEGPTVPSPQKSSADSFGDQLDRREEHLEIIRESNVDSRLR